MSRKSKQSTPRIPVIEGIRVQLRGRAHLGSGIAKTIKGTWVGMDWDRPAQFISGRSGMAAVHHIDELEGVPDENHTHGSTQ